MSDYEIENEDEFFLTLDESTPYVNFTAPVILLEEYPQSLIYFGVICYVTFVVVGVPANVVTVIALLKSPRLRNATSAFIINLCIADIFYCSSTIPLSAVTLFRKRWDYGHTACVVFAFIRYSNAAILMLTVVGIAINRYILIVHSQLYEKIYSKFGIAASIGLIWIFPCVLLAPTAARMWGLFIFDPQVGECAIVSLNGKSPKTFIYVFLFCLPTVAFVYCYAMIFYTVAKSEETVSSPTVVTRNDGGTSWFKCYGNRKGTFHKGTRRSSKDLKLLRMIFVILVASLLCYFPHFLVKVFRMEEALPALNILGFVGQYFSTCINPLIYVVMSDEYRKAYRSLYAQSRKSDVRNSTVHQ